MQRETNRREFLQRSTGAALAATTLSGAYAAASEKSDTIRLGIIGCGGMMGNHVKGLVNRREAVSFAWLCDVDPRQIDKLAAVVSGFQSTPPKTTKRYEDVVADRDVDAVIIATPHHWHAPIALEAIQEGKDVYIEKPISHVFDEGPRIVEAARKHGRVVQHGTQMRSSPVTEKAGRLLKEGVIGEIRFVKAWTAEVRRAVKPLPDGQPPDGVDYNRWLGPAPKRPFNPRRFHRTWRLFRDYGNGEIGDDGIHDVDMAVWALNPDTLPTQITARGGRMLPGEHYSEFPDNLNVTYEYPDGRLLIYENYPMTTNYGLHGFDDGNAFYGTEGYMLFTRRGAFSVFLGPNEKPGPTEGDLRGQRGYAEHMADFLHAVRHRTPTRANAQIAQHACALVHLGDIAYRTRGRLDFDPDTQRFVKSEEANRLLTKDYREPWSLPS